jgi:fatty acid desaturase
MRTTLKACRLAMLTAIINGILALTLMLLAEFAFSGNLTLAAPYLWAGLLICLVIFSAQFYRQLQLCKRGVRHDHPGPL